MKKIKLYYFMIFLILLAFLMCNRSQSLSGRYVMERNKRAYIEFKSDGTFYVEEYSLGMKQSAAGKYQIDGKVITLILGSGSASRGEIEGNTFIDKDGDRWVK